MNTTEVSEPKAEATKPISLSSEVSQLQKLQPLVGQWRGEGYSYNNGKEQVTTSRDSYEWLEGEHFLIHRWDWLINNETKFQGIEMLGYNEDRHMFFATMYDNAGHKVSYDVLFKDDIFTYHGEYDGLLHRAKLCISQDGQTMTDKWHTSEDGKKWKPLCDMKWNKLS